MGFWSNLLGGKRQSSLPPDEHAVIVHFQYGQRDLKPLFELEKKLEKAVAAARAGELDGNEVATDYSDGYLYLYGEDGDALLEAIRPVLVSAKCISDISVKVRYGPPKDGVRERKESLNS